MFAEVLHMLQLSVSLFLLSSIKSYSFDASYSFRKFPKKLSFLSCLIQESVVNKIDSNTLIPIEIAH